MGRSASRTDLIEPTRHIGSLGIYGEDWPDADLVELDAEDLAYVGRGQAPDPEPTVARPSRWSLEEDAVTVVDLPPSECVTRPIPEVKPGTETPPTALMRSRRAPSPYRGYVPGQRIAAPPGRPKRGLRVLDVLVLFASLCTILVLLAMMAGMMAGILV